MFRFVYVVIVFGFFLNSARADDPAIPNALKEWRDWVLHEHPSYSCPYQFNRDNKTCLWSAGLNLDLNDQGGSFDYHVRLFADGWVTLPGEPNHWPMSVMSEGKPVVVIERNGRPKTFLKKGQYQLQGELQWLSMPRALLIPSSAGLVQLSLAGEDVAHPIYEARDRLRLAQVNEVKEAAERDSLDIKVFRKLVDSNPALLETRLMLDISGSEREVSSGPALLDGFVIRSLQSDLPARVEKNGQLRIQVKPGRWQIVIIAHSTTPLSSLSYQPVNEHWPQQEIWSFQAQPSLRTVQLSGLLSIDPQQTQLPEEWRALPSYLADPQALLVFQEQQRGQVAQQQNQLNLEKTLWLDFDGSGFTVLDKLSGHIQQGRIEASDRYRLERAEQAGEPLLVTQLSRESDAEQAAGVEIRDANLDLMAISRVDRLVELPASGWQTDFDGVRQTLNLPPGWSLLHAEGPDHVRGSWVNNWSLWHIFLFLLVVVALARSFSWKVGVLAFITLILTYHRPNALIFVWLNFAALYALQPYLKGRVQHWATRYTALSFIACLLLLAPFAVEQVRLAIYPQLEQNSVRQVRNFEPETLGMFNPQSKRNQEGENDSSLEEVIVQGIRSEDIGEFPDEYMAESLMRTKQAVLPNLSKSKSSYSRYEIGQKIQVGPGIPSWQWSPTLMRWSGPVTQAQIQALWLASPIWNRLGYLAAPFLQLILLLVVARYFYRNWIPSVLSRFRNTAFIVPLFVIFVYASGTPSNAFAATLPSEDLLGELQERLLEEPDCLPVCATIESVGLNIKEDRVHLTIGFNTMIDMAVPLPANVEGWLPDRITLNGESTGWLQSRRGQLFIRLQKGRHQVQLFGSSAGREQIVLSFRQPVHNVSVSNSAGWKIQGIPVPGQSSETLQLERKVETQPGLVARLLQDPITPYVRVHRTIQLGLEWQVVTRVERIAPRAGAIHLSVPLLSGEAPVNGQLNSEGAMQVFIEDGQSSYVWSSTLKQKQTLELRAANSDSLHEVWRLGASSIWHIDVSGIVAQAGTGESRDWVWLPWANETVTVDVIRPQAIEGRQLSIDAVSLTLNAGKRTQSNQLKMTVRASQGSVYDLNLPPGAQFKQLTINGNERPANLNDSLLSIPIVPGENRIQLEWNQDSELAIKTKTPDFQLATPASNVRLSIHMPRDRWLLFVGGPKLGPAVLFWGIFVVVLVVAVVLGKTQMTPLNPLQWILLSIGVVTIDLYLLMLIAAWFIVLYFRGQRQSVPSHHGFNLLQLGLLVFSLIALGALVASVPASLLSNPNMMIAGNGSHASTLNWYQDLTNGALPTAFAITLPITYYRIAMLLWSIWLALSLMRWLPWAWHQMRQGGFWFTPPRKPKAGNSNKSAPETKQSDVPSNTE